MNFKTIVRPFYCLYQLVVALPITIVATIITALTTAIGCTIGNGHFWGYYPGKCWSWLVMRVFLLPVHVSGRDNIKRGQSYVFVANHQGAFDIFLIYGFLGRNFKWMMKRGIMKIPFVGFACKAAHHIFVDRKPGSGHMRKAYTQARATLSSGMSLVVFPEGSRTLTGRVGPFKKGAYALADELQLPVVPLTIDGSYDVMPRSRDGRFIHWHPIRLTIHPAIARVGQGPDNVEALMEQSRKAILSSLNEPQD